MSVVVTVWAPLDAATYDGLIGFHEPVLRTQAGFRVHYAQPAADSGWLVTEVWDTREEHAAWFDSNVRPHLPAEAKTTVTPVHHAIVAEDNK